MDDSEILYVDQDKKRTDGLLQCVGRQLPSDATFIGSIGTITYTDSDVNISGVIGSKLEETEEQMSYFLTPLLLTFPRLFASLNATE